MIQRKPTSRPLEHSCLQAIISQNCPMLLTLFHVPEPRFLGDGCWLPESIFGCFRCEGGIEEEQAKKGCRCYAGVARVVPGIGSRKGSGGGCEGDEKEMNPVLSDVTYDLSLSLEAHPPKIAMEVALAHLRYFNGTRQTRAGASRSALDHLTPFPSNLFHRLNSGRLWGCSPPERWLLTQI